MKYLSSEKQERDVKTMALPHLKATEDLLRRLPVTQYYHINRNPMTYRDKKILRDSILQEIQERENK